MFCLKFKGVYSSKLFIKIIEIVKISMALFYLSSLIIIKVVNRSDGHCPYQFK